MITSLKRLFKEDWIQTLNVEEFLSHFRYEEMDPEVQDKWIDIQNPTNNEGMKNHFIFMTDSSMIKRLELNPTILFSDCSHKVSNIPNGKQY